jgi:hypothetical protein
LAFDNDHAASRIAKTNDYECLDAWISMDFAARQYKPDVAEFFVDYAGMFRMLVRAIVIP